MKPWAATRQRLRGIAWVLVGGSVVFAGIAMGRAFGPAGVGALTLPLALLASAGVIAVALLTRWYPVRPIAQGLAVFGALVHLLVLLRSGPIWTRGCSAILTVTHLYALVMLFVVSANEPDDPDPASPRVDDSSTPSRRSQHTESAVSAPSPAAVQPGPVPESGHEPVPGASVAEARPGTSGGEPSLDAGAPPGGEAAAGSVGSGVEAVSGGDDAPGSEVAPRGEAVFGGEAAPERETVPDGEVASGGGVTPDAPAEPEPEPSTEEREPVESAVGGAAAGRPARPEENK